jgi:hypothetical protein
MLSTKRSLVALLLFSGAACESAPPPTRAKAPAPAPPAVAKAVETPPAPPPVAKPAPPPAGPTSIGMLDPFARLDTKTARKLNEGYTALRKKKYADARAAFREVVTAAPDHTGARYEELRAAVRERDFAAVPALWRALLARDHVGYAGRLDKSKEMAPLRESTVWGEVQAIEAELGARYAAGLGKGFLFVARLRPYGAPKFADDEAAKLELEQEAFHFDPDSKRIRRVSKSGRVVAIHRDGNKLMLLAARWLRKLPGAGTAFGKPEASLVSLDTLEQTGPIAIDADARAVKLCFSAKGEPVWAVSGPTADKALTLDATGSTLVPLEEGCGAAVATTLVDPMRVVHRRPDPEGVALSDDGHQLTGVDADKPVRASEAIRAGSLTWSPGKKRFAYSGTGDRCAVKDDHKPATSALFVWNAEQKKAARLSGAGSFYELVWLDDDRLAYEARTEGGAKLTIHDFASGGAPLTIKTPSGAGLHGLPTLPCGDRTLAMIQ